MQDNHEKPKDPLPGPEEDQMGDYYTGGRAIQEKAFGAGQSAVEGQQKIDPGYAEQQPPEDTEKPRTDGGQGGSQSGFGGYGAGPGSLERQANRTSPARGSGTRDTDEPED